MPLWRDSWQFSCRISEKETRISSEKPQLHEKRLPYVRVMLYLCILRFGGLF